MSEHDDPLAKVIWDAASCESSMDLPPWESLSGDRRVAHDVARSVREYLRDVEGLVSSVTDQSACDEEIVKTAPTTSPAQQRHEEVRDLLTEIRDALIRKQTRSYIERKTSNYAHDYDSGGKVRSEPKESTYEGEQRSRIMRWLFPIRCRYCGVRKDSFDAMRECITNSVIASEHTWRY